MVQNEQNYKITIITNINCNPHESKPDHEIKRKSVTSALSFSSLSLSATALRSSSVVTLAAFFIRRKSAPLITNVCPDGSSRGTLNSTLRYDTTEEFIGDSKAEYTAY